jgi:antitoxin Phd
MDEIDFLEDNAMNTVTANDAKQNFGKVIDEALQGPVSVTKHGRPSVVITSNAAYQELLALKRELLTGEVRKGFESLDRGERSPRSAEQIAEAVLRQHSDSA